MRWEGQYMKAAEAIARCLREEKIDTVFGYPGAAIGAVYDAIANEGIRHILVRHETNGGHSASGFARVSGRPSVCLATSGPGATNLLTAIATAYMDSIPVVFITGQVSTDQVGRDVFQEADITGASEPFIKHSFLIKNASEIPTVFRKAFHIAGTGRKGPVLIDIPYDIQNAEIDFSYPEKISMRSYKPTTKGNKLQIKRIVEALSDAKRPVICAGGGVLLSSASDVLKELATKLDIPVVTTMMGLGAIGGEHPLSIGMIGNFGSSRANYAVNKCDVIILVGARVGDRAINSPTFIEKTTKIIHIDIDPAEIGKNMSVDIPVVGDAGVVLGQLLDASEPMKHTEWREKLSGMELPEKKYPHTVIEKFSQLAPDAICVADVGQHLIWTANSFSVGEGGRFLASGGMGTMGYAIPAAAGAKLASPDKTVIAFVGDGGFQMSMMEMATLVQNNIAVKIVVFDNRGLGMVREYQRMAGLKEFAVDLSGGPDYIMLAKAYGIEGERIKEGDNIEKAVRKALSDSGSYILVCEVSPDERSVL